MSIQEWIKHAYQGIRLLRQAQKAFRLSSQGNDHGALEMISRAKSRYGRLTQYKFGIELTLLEIFTTGLLVGIHESDYDWTQLRDVILSSTEYNDSEKIHLLVYLEELATTAGSTLSISDLTRSLSAKQKVSRHLVRRFPKLAA